MPIMRWKTYDSYEDEDEEPVVPWRTFDSYEANDPDEELKPVNKVTETSLKNFTSKNVRFCKVTHVGLDGGRCLILSFVYHELVSR